MTVRQLTPHDAAAYQQLRLRGLQESPTAFSASYSDEAARSLAEIAVRVTPAPDGSLCVFGAYADGQLVGIVAFIRPSREKLRHCAELAGMYVAPEFRQRGLGRTLLDAALAHGRSLRGVRQLKLAVNAANTAARALYQSRGFTRYGVEPEALLVAGCYYDEELYVLRLTEAPEPDAEVRGAR
ncbi:MAG TPA: GNAT family N-acetyltransferase [Blastocatellia bacterium]|nr:GNAT family N-acetyltransferase [Blastocatellia bacterium]